ncbi:Sialic acid TRAP transporter permease protein SiaT [Planctomycetes bacterium Pla163]|uniref:Sialic acid TRAP transporter permease protein SiaT n=1 Tax=Rohdeia mirabilis TaxID=2528008 RepID=A0A518CVY1_9BACT|nr:Sialic acid TRAP transporter permease protein SiaT [Planctomycetes bacterium Pla163]
MEYEWLGPALFLAAFVLIFLGYPVAFSLAGSALAFAWIGVELDVFPVGILGAFPSRVFGVMSNQVLMAVPFFIFMGTTLQRSRLAEDLLHTVGLIFGARRGGLALAVVIVGTLLAAATGVVGASVVAMGMISLPIMLRYGYKAELATGVIAASGTLGQIVPPSVVLVVLGDQMGVGVGDLFRGALVPGLSLALLYGIYVLVIARLRPTWAPALPKEELPASRSELSGRVLRVMVPPLVLIALVLGSIFAGLASPTEAGAVGSVGALVLAGISGRLTRGVVSETAHETMRLTAMVVMLLIGATLFTLVFRGLHGDEWIQRSLTSLPGGRVGLLIVANLVVFGLGFFLDFFEIAFIVIPLLSSAMTKLGFSDTERVWVGVLLALNLQTSFLTPPFGFSLFYLRGVTPREVPTGAIYRGALPFIGIQLFVLAMVALFPELVTGMLQSGTRP